MDNDKSWTFVHQILPFSTVDIDMRAHGSCIVFLHNKIYAYITHIPEPYALFIGKCLLFAVRL